MRNQVSWTGIFLPVFEIIVRKLINCPGCSYIVDIFLFIFALRWVPNRVSSLPPHAHLRSPQVSPSYFRDVGSKFLTELFTSRIQMMTTLRIIMMINLLAQMNLISSHHWVSPVLESIWTLNWTLEEQFSAPPELRNKHAAEFSEKRLDSSSNVGRQTV